MSDADARLKALFADDAPPARDPAFSAVVMEALARRRFRTDLALLAGASAVGGLALWALWPVFQPLVTDTSQALFPAVAVLAAAAGLILVLNGRLTPAFDS
jgi:hypothetical protein